MAGIARGELLPLKDVAEVAPAVGALDLHPLPVRVGEAANRPGDLPVEGWPATMRIEFVVRAVERCTTPLALVRSGGEESVVLARERRLGPLVDDDPFLGAGEGSKGTSGGVGHTGSSGAPYKELLAPAGGLDR